MTRPLSLAAPDPEQVMPYNKSSMGGTVWQGIKNGSLHLNKSYPGNWKQLGGEFIFSPGFKCDFAHRMTYGTSESRVLHKRAVADNQDHMEAVDVLKYAGLDEQTRTGALRKDVLEPVGGQCELNQ